MSDSKPQLSLPETRLSFAGNELIRLSEDDDVLLRIPLAEVQELRIVKRFNAFGMALAGAGLAIGWIAFRIAESNVVTVLLSIVALLVILFGALTVFENRLCITTSNGPLWVSFDEADDVAEGFVASANRILKKQ